MTDRYFDDFRPGDVIVTPVHTVTEDEVLRFAREFDPQTFHVEPAAAANPVFGSGIVAGGFHSAALVWALVVRCGHFRACSLAGLGVDGLRWRTPLRPGDTVHVRGIVREARPSASRPGAGVLSTHYQLLNQRNEIVVEMVLVNLLLRRPGSAESEPAVDAGAG